jgi:acyl-[acyl-carrier-protein]-phospholipid O-acyltransferase/long-chain-fatty-acid--[acyl-carrier-protein] ligase
MGSAGGLAVLAALCGLTIAGGLYQVPAMAAVQAWSPPERRARVIAAINVINAVYMLGGGAAVAGLQAVGVGVGPLFTTLGALSFLACLYVLREWGFALNGNLGRAVQRLSLSRR